MVSRRFWGIRGMTKGTSVLPLSGVWLKKGKRRVVFQLKKILEILNWLRVSFLLLPHNPPTYAFSYSRVISHQARDDTSECRAPKMCRVLLRAPEYRVGALPREPV